MERKWRWGYKHQANVQSRCRRCKTQWDWEVWPWTSWGHFWTDGGSVQGAREAGGSSYFCSCDIVDFMNKESRVGVKDELKSHLWLSSSCERLERYRCQAVVLEGHKTLLFPAILLCWSLKLVWFKMYLNLFIRPCAWEKKTCKSNQSTKKGRYDAFSEKDSVQIELNLVPNHSSEFASTRRILFLEDWSRTKSWMLQRKGAKHSSSPCSTVWKQLFSY